MLKRDFRLSDSKDFQTVYRRGRFNATALFSVNVLPNRFGGIKIGVVVNKKVAKNSHERNRVKRQTREIVRALLPQLKKGQNIVVTIRQPALAADFEIMKNEILISFNKLGLLESNENITKDD